MQTIKVREGNLWSRLTTPVLLAAALILCAAAASAEQPNRNPGQPFEQIEAKLDKLEGKLDTLPPSPANAIARLESKLDALPPSPARAIARLETKLDKLESKLDTLAAAITKLESKVDVLLPPPDTDACDNPAPQCGDRCTTPDGALGICRGEPGAGECLCIGEQ